MKKNVGQQGLVSGFSKKTKAEKIEWISAQFTNPQQATELLETYTHPDPKTQNLHDEFIENAVANFYLPLGVAPNVIINGKTLTIPMAIEESSVVAAASNAAKFWADKGGFTAEILGTEKVGQVHFIFEGTPAKLQTFFDTHKATLLESTDEITKKMRTRGGGITALSLADKTALLEGYFQLDVRFDTKDAMGANFINSCLEQLAATLQELALEYDAFSQEEKELEVVMSILSNHVPNCLVKASVSCPVDALMATPKEGQRFAEKFVQAVRIAELEPYRAVTHNKGIMNGVDAVVIASGNDFRAVAAGVHAYAAESGQYRSLSKAEIKEGVFHFSLTLPLAIGTVGGLTKLHPLVRWSHELMGFPNSEELMQIIAVAGLAQNFAAVKSLVTTGIQQGHMKMHLLNILNQLGATETEKKAIVKHFIKNTVSHHAVVEALEKLRAE
ncbi:MAG: hydroxymethylglutaryl-CoA reductase, degradative [Flavobacteriaceae bacterium]